MIKENLKCQANVYEVDGDLVTVLLNARSLDLMNWSWDSLVYAGEETVLVNVESGLNDKMIQLIPHGNVCVYRCEDENGEVDKIKLENSEIRELAKKGELTQNYSKYEIEQNNFFSLDVYEKNGNRDYELVEDFVFEAIPGSLEELRDLLIKEYIEFFY